MLVPSKSLGVCPRNSKHQITMVTASREGYLEFCAQCSKWRVKIDLKPIRAELRELGLDPDEGMLENLPTARETKSGEC